MVDDFEGLASLWHQGWHDAHAKIVSAQMREVRTPQNFRERVEGGYRDMKVIGGIGAPKGFHILKQNELAHLYVDRHARGTGVAAELLRDAEGQIADAGFATAWLACAVGNDRAGQFYEKYGWLRKQTTVIQIETPIGSMPLEVWRYEKNLADAPKS